MSKISQVGLERFNFKKGRSRSFAIFAPAQEAETLPSGMNPCLETLC